MYINIGANNGSEKLWTKNTATYDRLCHVELAGDYAEPDQLKLAFRDNI